MSIEIVKPIIEDGIEFYVSSDGTQVGVSISGLARLCGVKRASLSDILGGVGKTMPQALKHLQGNVFTPQLDGANGAKIINSKAATQIIKYYAYESKAANDTAKFSLDKFIDIGFVSWVKQITGFSVTNNNAALTQTINQLFSNVKLLTEEMKEWRTVRRVADDNMEGVNILIEEINKSEEVKQPEIDSRTYTLLEWLEEEKGISKMTHGNKTKLGRAVSETYKALRQTKPARTTRIVRNRRTNAMMPSRTNGYTSEDFPILEVAYNKFMLR